jgi:hypothetical protein
MPTFERGGTMKINNTTLAYQRVVGFLLTVAYLLFLSTAVFAQEKTPPKPKEPSTILRMPNPVTVQEMKGRATLPEQLSHGFAIDVAEKVLSGNWDVRGKVIALENGTVAFKTEKEETGHLVFRLPKGMRFIPKPNQQISIKRAVQGFGGSLGHMTRLTSENELILASGRLYGDRPREGSVFQKLSLRQVSDRTQVASKTKYETTYKVPVVLTSDGASVRLSIGEPAEFTFAGRKFLALVTESSETIPAKEYEGIAEGKGFSLEYVISLK